jgi:uncharacterized protein (TIGR00299 family) protein
MHDRPHRAGEHEHGHEHEGEHGHEHAHAHDGRPHEHGHAHHRHAHDHEHDELRAPSLARGAGRGKVLFFDAFSGVSGDMTISALLGLGVPLLTIETALAALPLEGYHLHRGHAHRSGIAATSFEVHVEREQPHRTYGSIDAMLAASPLEPGVRDLARAIFAKLGQAEAFVHQMPLAEVHFHEVGAVDAIVDVVGAAAAIEHLGVDDVVCAPLPLGRGFIRAAHGVLPNPPPAVVECLRGVPTRSVDLDVELVTPTGAAIVATLAKRFSRWPAMRPERSSYGAGARELPDRPNLLRLVLGAPEGEASLELEASRAPYALLEANVDDLTGELAGHALASLLEKGALDAWATPITMKKGRPGLVLSALVPAVRADELAGVMMSETTTLGVRRAPVTRLERPRRTVTVSTPWGAVRVKVSEGPFGPPIAKPEFDDVVSLARSRGVPVRDVLGAATLAALRLVTPEPDRDH